MTGRNIPVSTLGCTWPSFSCAYMPPYLLYDLVSFYCWVYTLRRHSFVGILQYPLSHPKMGEGGPPGLLPGFLGDHRTGIYLLQSEASWA